VKPGAGDREAGRPDVALLEQLLDLTPAEARLAASLIEGKAVHEFPGQSYALNNASVFFSTCLMFFPAFFV
jgi:hypothetical protein